MGAKKLGQQIEDVKTGDTLQFIRRVVDRHGVPIGRNRATMCYVVDDGDTYSDKLVTLAYSRPLRHDDGHVMDWTFSWNGFKYCRLVDKQQLIDNCRKVEYNLQCS